PFSTAAEMAIVRRLCARVGWTEGFGGFGTHGGTLANLTALLTARNVAFPEIWEKGAAVAADAVALVSADSHYSLARAVGVLGLGTENLIKIPLDSRRRIRV